MADPDQYKGLVADVRAFLAGDKERLLPALHERLERAATLQDFERAGKLRDQIRRLDRISLEQAHINVLADAGHLLIVLPGLRANSRQVWHLYRGVRWATYDVAVGEAVEALAARLERSRARAEVSGQSVVMTHHTVDEASITSRWVRKYSTADAVVQWQPGITAEELAGRLLAVAPLDPDVLDDDDEEGDEE
jgi:excinuclease UvrABC nuclease subunit